LGVSVQSPIRQSVINVTPWRSVQLSRWWTQLTEHPLLNFEWQVVFLCSLWIKIFLALKNTLTGSGFLFFDKELLHVWR